MDKQEKLGVIDKMLRELEDSKNSQTSVIKKLAQIESENINLGDKVLDEKLPDVFKLADDTLNAIADLETSYLAVREKFVKDNKLEETVEV